MRSPKYTHPIFPQSLYIRTGFFNVYVNKTGDYSTGCRWDTEDDADKYRRGARNCIYRLNIRARVQEARV